MPEREVGGVLWHMSPNHLVRCTITEVGPFWITYQDQTGRTLKCSPFAADAGDREHDSGTWPERERI